MFMRNNGRVVCRLKMAILHLAACVIHRHDQHDQSNPSCPRYRICQLMLPGSGWSLVAGETMLDAGVRGMRAPFCHSGPSGSLPVRMVAVG